MVVVQLPELDVDHIEVFIAEEVKILIDLWFGLDVHETLEDAGFLELAEGHLVVVLSVGHVVHTVDRAEGVPLLELWRLLQKLETRMCLQNLLEEHLEICYLYVLLLGIGG
jgi:hypothetical protein